MAAAETTATNTPESPAKSGFDNLVPMALTPVRASKDAGGRNKELTPWDELFEKVVSKQETSKLISEYRSWLNKALDFELNDLAQNWSQILEEIQTRWVDIFPQLEGVDYVTRFRALERKKSEDANDSQIGPLFHLVPFLNFSISSHFATGKLFFNFIAALSLGVFLSRTVCSEQGEDEGFCMYQALQSHTGNRFITKFFNWFVQHVANRQKEFDKWAATATIPDSLLHLITNVSADESVLSHLGTTGYNQFTLSEPLPLTKAQRILDQLNGNHIMNTLKLKGGMTKLYSEILFQIGATDTTCQVTEEMVTQMDQDLLFYLPQIDPVERARIRNSWGISILLTVSETKNNPLLGKLLGDDTAFYIHIAKRSGAKVSNWFLKSIPKDDGNKSTTPPGTNNKSDRGAEKRKRND